MIRTYLRRMAAIALASNLVLVMPGSLLADHGKDDAESIQTTTPIKHVIVIFQENISFDHYFATYPFATNPMGETRVPRDRQIRRASTISLSGGLLTENPNSTQPFRMDTGVMSVTCDQNHSYGPEQQAADHGLMDKFPESTGSGNSASFPCNDYGKGTGVVMGYFDGNTVTALWNYAQHFAMSDNSYGTMFGPSTVGALNLIAGTTATATLVPARPNGKPASASGNIANGIDDGSGHRRSPAGRRRVRPDEPGLQNTNTISVAGTNVGDLLNAEGITWGWFQGGFAPTGYDAHGPRHLRRAPRWAGGRRRS